MWNLRRTYNEQKKEKAAHGDDIFGVFQNTYEKFSDVQAGRCEYDNERGAVNIPKGVTRVTVRRKAE
jgi:hypothetical protein